MSFFLFNSPKLKLPYLTISCFFYYNIGSRIVFAGPHLCKCLICVLVKYSLNKIKVIKHANPHICELKYFTRYVWFLFVFLRIDTFSNTSLKIFLKQSCVSFRVRTCSQNNIISGYPFKNWQTVLFIWHWYSVNVLTQIQINLHRGRSLSQCFFIQTNSFA